MSQGCTTGDHRLGASNSRPLLSHRLEAPSPKSRCGQGHSRGARGASFLPLAASGGISWFVATSLQPPSTFTWPLPSLLLPLIRTLVRGFRAHPDNPGGFHPESLKSVASAKTLIPSKITFGGSKWTYVGVEGTVQPTTHAFSPYSLILVDTSFTFSFAKL